MTLFLESWRVTFHWTVHFWSQFLAKWHQAGQITVMLDLPTSPKEKLQPWVRYNIVQLGHDRITDSECVCDSPAILQSINMQFFLKPIIFYSFLKEYWHKWRGWSPACIIKRLPGNSDTGYPLRSQNNCSCKLLFCFICETCWFLEGN